MSHNWEANSTLWDYVKRQLSDRLRPTVGDRFRVIVWDFPGLEKSSKPKNNDHYIEKYARGLEALVPTLASSGSTKHKHLQLLMFLYW